MERADAGRARAGRPRRAGRRARASSCSARSRPRTAVSIARGATVSRRARATSRTTPTSRTACIELHVATGDATLAARVAPARAARGRALRRPRRAASSRRPSTASNSSRGRSSSTITRRRAGTRCSPTCCCALARIWGDDELERRAVVGASARPRRAAEAPPSRSAGCWSRSTSTSRRTASSRSSAHPRDDVARGGARAGRSATDVVAFGPADDVPLLAGRVAGRRAADALRLRATSRASLPVTDPASVPKLTARWRCSRFAT